MKKMFSFLGSLIIISILLLACSTSENEIESSSIDSKEKISTNNSMNRSADDDMG
ncbi:hypothetical protein PFY12_10400 [Chryseobacterium camelliae]|uniref:Cytochrome C551 n=1 Tax=Chryseobacterium camelliae TaxID=1265445 RepID=A0ABY7QLB6_9FLAO|nr:hypothetical protein [Chryseobacterium camelliae]WBV59468.1 hypothetical protein PFY12_10400 [Chryseobacterium camelliae]